MKAMRIKWEDHPNPTCRTLHCDRRLPYFTGNTFQMDDYEDETPEATKLRTALEAIDGIEDCSA